MKLSFVKKHRFHFAVGAVAVAMILAAMMGEMAVASSMGFKMNKQITTGTPGRNLVALPFRTPVAFAKDLCAVFGKTTSATSLVQFTGTGTQPHTCDSAVNGFPITAKGIGILIQESGASATGILVGSHIPGQSVTIPDAGLNPVGTQLYAYPYHTTNVNANDICVNAGLTANTSLVRFPPGGGTQAFLCGAAPGTAFNLVLGEAVLVQNEVNGPKSFVPSHF